MRESSLPTGNCRIHEVESNSQLGFVELTASDLACETLEVLYPSLSVVRAGDYQALDCDDGHSAVTGRTFLLPRTMPAGRRAEPG